MSLNLKKPLVFFDIEATGLNISKDRIIELSFLKNNPDDTEATRTWRVNPEVPISEESYQIHGISQEDVKDLPLFKEIAQEVVNFIGNGDLSGFNIIKFDLPLLMEELLRVDVKLDLSKRKLIDVQRIFHKMEKRNLEAAYRFYCQKELQNAHSAEDDTRATHEILQAQVNKYQELENDIDFLNEFTGAPDKYLVDLAGRIVYNKNGEEVFNFGKYKGKPVKDVLKKDPSYYSWMMNGDFPQYTKQKLTELRLKLSKE